MKKLLLNNPIVDMWKEAYELKNPLAYLSSLVVTGLVIIAVTGLTIIITSMIINPNMWDNVQFGIYDTLGT